MSSKTTDDNLVAVSHQSNDYSNCARQVRKEEGKNAKFMDDQQLPSKKEDKLLQDGPNSEWDDTKFVYG